MTMVNNQILCFAIDSMRLDLRVYYKPNCITFIRGGRQIYCKVLYFKKSIRYIF